MAKKTSLSDPLGIRVKDRGLNRGADETRQYPEHPLDFKVIRQPSLETPRYTKARLAREQWERETPSPRRQKGRS